MKRLLEPLLPDDGKSRGIICNDECDDNAPMMTVLFFMSGYSWAEKRHRDVILEFARERQWRIQCVPYAQAEASRYNLINCSVAKNIQGLIDFWHPDGCIVECGAAQYTLQPKDFGSTPVVFLDRSPSTLRGHGVCVFNDAHAVAQAAFDELWGTGIRNFAYAGWYQPLGWSEERRVAFAGLLSKAKLPLHLLDMTNRRAIRNGKWLMGALKRLPHPLAVFAVNDLIAEQIVSVCSANGLSVPHDVAVVGVDNAEDVCENSVVTITSVPQDYLEAGRQACKILCDLMDGRTDEVHHMSYGVGKIIRRASTRLAGGDRRLTLGLEFIRLNVGLSLQVEDVVRAMSCSRRTAELLFRRGVGHTIREEVTQVRMVKALTLLESSQMPVAVVSDRCGFASVNDFDRVFRRALGCAPSHWRKHVAQ